MAADASPPVITDASVTLTFGAAGQYYGYCTIADVKFEFPNAGSFSTLTNSVVGQEITYAALELQKMLDHFYVMPYTGTSFNVTTTLREMNAKLATARIIKRYFSGSEPDFSPEAESMRQEVEMLVTDIENCNLRLEDPWGDATPRAMLPVYDLATGATIYPNPSIADTSAATPIFTIARPTFKRDDQF